MFIPCEDVCADAGYPSEAELESIRSWPIEEFSEFEKLLGYVGERWRYPDRWYRAKRRRRKKWPASRPERTYYASTGGWSGNESLIDALQENQMFWMVCWEKSQRGGHYWFEVPK